MLTTIQDTVRLSLPAKRKTNPTSGWTSFTAPCCPHNGESADTRGRGGVIMNPDGSISYSCFNCGYKASYQPGRHLTYKFRKLLSWLGASENEIKRLVIDAIRIKDLVAPEQLETAKKEEISFKARPLPQEAKTILSLAAFYQLGGCSDVPEDYLQAVQYLMDRNIDLNRHTIYWTPETEHNYHKRVIVPCYWHGQLIGSTARTFVDSVKPKYYSDYEPNFVFNIDRQTPDRKFVIVVEGSFDAMAIDGVAVLSNECNEVQADIIDGLGREVIVVPDFDVKIVKGRRVWSGSTLVDDALEFDWSVSFPVWHSQCKDVSEAVKRFGRLFTLKAILAGKESSHLKIELQRKKIYNSI